MFKFLKIYKPFAVASIKAEYLSYRLNTMIWVFQDILSIIIIFFLWKAIFNNAETELINNLSFAVMIYYYLISKIVSSFTNVEFGQDISNDVRKGTLSIHLIKPISYKTYLLFKALGRSIGAIIFFGIYPIIGIFLLSKYYGLDVDFTIARVTAFMLSSVLAFYIGFSIKMFTGAVRLFTINGFGIYNFEQALFQLFSGALIPIMLLPETAQKIFSFLPFQYSLFTPTSIMIGIEDSYWQAILIQLIWVVILGISSTYVWKKSSEKAVILGG